MSHLLGLVHLIQCNVMMCICSHMEDYLFCADILIQEWNVSDAFIDLVLKFNRCTPI
jgi:hypothetical protein